MRCRFSAEGLQTLNPRPAHREREGKIIGSNPRKKLVTVMWDGLVRPVTYAQRFIQRIDAPSQTETCEVDLTRAPILRELLGRN